MVKHGGAVLCGFFFFLHQAFIPLVVHRVYGCIAAASAPFLVTKGTEVGEVAFELGFERFPKSNSCNKCWQAALFDHV